MLRGYNLVNDYEDKYDHLFDVDRVHKNGHCIQNRFKHFWINTLNRSNKLYNNSCSVYYLKQKVFLLFLIFFFSNTVYSNMKTNGK